MGVCLLAGCGRYRYEAGADAADGPSSPLIDSTPAMLDTPVRISDNDLLASQLPRLSWTGTEFGVVWQDGRAGTNEVYFVRAAP